MDFEKINKLNLDDNAKICAPIVGKDWNNISAELETAISVNPDLLEWRADFLDNTDIANIIDILHRIHETVPDFPLIFTLRVLNEGGGGFISQAERELIIKKVINTRLVDIVDIELSNGGEFIDSISYEASKNGVLMILSHHDFTETPPENEIISILTEMVRKKCHIAKIAVMPKCVGDVISVFNAVNVFSETHDTRIISISMSEIGMVSRIFANLFKSCITFGSLCTPSAPGQISVEELRKALDTFNRVR